MGGDVADLLMRELLDVEAMVSRVDADHLAALLVDAGGRGAGRRVPEDAVRARGPRARDAHGPAAAARRRGDDPGRAGERDRGRRRAAALRRPALRRPRQLCDLFRRCGKPELDAVVTLGGWGGLLLGVFQMGAWALYPRAWTLSLGGAFVGFATDWAALKILFSPVEPRKIGPLTVQGLFLRRQAEVSADFADFVAAELVAPEHLWRALLTGPRRAAVVDHVVAALRAELPGLVASAGDVPAQLAELADRASRARRGPGAHAADGAPRARARRAMDDDSNMPPTTAATPRLMIEKMVLENFKSYGGQREIGPFHKRFSSIVGPNGSGKSNVIDAMLFVFGKRAKKLRLNKVSELIHKSDTYPDLDWAKVSVHSADVIDLQDGTDAYEVVPGTEVVCEVRLEKLNRLRVAEKEREALSSAKAEAEAYVVAEDKIRRQRNTLYQVLRREAAANVAFVGERHDELAGRLAEERAKRAAIETSLSGDKAEVAALTKEHAAAAKAAEKAAAKASDGARRDAELREAKKHQEAAARKLEHAAKKDAAVAEEKEGFVAEQERDELPRLNKKVATMSAKADEARRASRRARGLQGRDDGGAEGPRGEDAGGPRARPG
ncbi:hypothetical protein JL720_11258 [Aureococcus anophagefferens]|nr:hypothetical protein JL720_11258 [Aureococcus anophagefferens]